MTDDDSWLDADLLRNVSVRTIRETIEQRFGRDAAHFEQGLADGCKRRIVERRGVDIIKSQYGDILRNAQPHFLQGPDSADRGHVVERK